MSKSRKQRQKAKHRTGLLRRMHGENKYSRTVKQTNKHADMVEELKLKLGW